LSGKYPRASDHVIRAAARNQVEWTPMAIPATCPKVAEFLIITLPNLWRPHGHAAHPRWRPYRARLMLG
jgi:hypothetical protein